MQHLVVECRDFGKTFTFALCHRPLELTPDVTVKYHWIDPSELRDTASPSGTRNIQTIIELFREAVRHHWDDGESDLRHVAAALAYLISRGDRSTQHILRDAFPSQWVTSRQKQGEFRPSEEDAARLAEIVAKRDRSAIAEELDRAVGYHPLQPKDFAEHQSVFELWISNGVSALRSNNGSELSRWHREMEAQIRSLRKNGGDQHRAFLNAFAYECKASFYHCYANAWTSQLLPWLIAHRNLDSISQRFLAFWHCQQRPVEIPLGLTAGGIVVPTHGVTSLLGPDGRLFNASFPMERIGSDHLPAVFRGQILALHPLSAFFMSDQACCLAAARFFGTDAHDFVFERGGAQLCGEYWDLVHGILLSALRYRGAQQSYEDQRARRPAVQSSEVSELSSPHRPALNQELRDRVCAELIRKMKKICPTCQTALEFRSVAASPSAGKRLSVAIGCDRCRRTQIADIYFEEFQEEFRRFGFPPEDAETD